MRRFWWRNTRSLFPVFQSMRNTSEGQSKDSLNSITLSPKPASDSRTQVTWPNNEPVLASQVFPPSRVWRKIETRGVSRRNRDSFGFIQLGTPKGELRCGGFQPVMMPTFVPAKSIQL